MKKMAKILLITPPYHSGVVESAGVWLNVGLSIWPGAFGRPGMIPSTTMP